MPDVVEPGARVVMSLLGKRPFQNYETNILPHLSHLQSALSHSYQNTPVERGVTLLFQSLYNLLDIIEARKISSLLIN